MIDAIVLIEAEPARIAALADELVARRGVAEVYSVTGEYDLVAMVRVGAHEDLADVVTRQSETMRQQVDHHLRRARAAARAQGPGERTAVGPVLEELTLTLGKVFQEDGGEVDWLAPDDLYFHGERQDLLEIAGNVMENACKWRTRRVWAKAEPVSAGQFRLTVEDDGPGLPEDGKDEVFKRGMRLDETAPGSGLGLSIVDELVKAYGGQVALSRSSMGGLKVEMLLPRAEA